MAYCPQCQAEMEMHAVECPSCGYGFPADIDADGVIGDGGKHRYFAACFDNFAAIVIALLVASQLTFLSQLAQGLSSYVIYLLFFFICEAHFARTPAKWYFGLTVIQSDGSRCTWSQAAIRTLSRIIEFDPLLLGGLPAALMILCTERKQRLGGLLSSTYVSRT